MNSTFDQIILSGSSVASISMALIAIASAIIAFFSFRDSKKRRKREKAIDLSSFYVSKILRPSVFISNAIRNTDFEKIAKECFGIDKIDSFDVSEVNSLLSNKNSNHSISKLNFLIDQIPAEKITSAALFEDKITEITEKTKIHAKYIKCDTDEDAKNFFGLEIQSEFKQDVVDLLNNIEWFAMNFISGVADEKTVYQSLHQTYLGLISQLYFFIARNNKDEHSKYYTNTIELFKIWRDRESKVKSKEEKMNSRENKKKKSLSKHQKRI